MNAGSVLTHLKNGSNMLTRFIVEVIRVTTTVITIIIINKVTPTATVAPITIATNLIAVAILALVTRLLIDLAITMAIAPLAPALVLVVITMSIDQFLIALLLHVLTSVVIDQDLALALTAAATAIQCHSEQQIPLFLHVRQISSTMVEHSSTLLSLHILRHSQTRHLIISKMPYVLIVSIVAATMGQLVERLTDFWQQQRARYLVCWIAVLSKQ